jgi:hypothetical protein
MCKASSHKGGNSGKAPRIFLTSELDGGVWQVHVQAALVPAKHARYTSIRRLGGQYVASVAGDNIYLAFI